MTVKPRSPRGKRASSRANGNGASRNGKGRPMKAQMTAAGIQRYSARESQPCGPRQAQLRLKAVAESQRSGDWRAKAGALEDAAAALIVWAQRIREDATRVYD